MNFRQSQQTSSISQFHTKIVNQLVLNLKQYQKQQHQYNQLQNQSQSSQTTSPLKVNQSDQPFTPIVIAQFLYDVLELENTSINFIMKDIFQAPKRNSWHLEEILKIVIDVQFVITVNNFIVAQHENLIGNKVKDEEISFLKIQPHQLVQNILECCFFIKSPQNTISKQLIQQIVQQINKENGNKGYILLLQYKNFMLHNMIEKHNARKFASPKKIKALTPNAGKYQAINSQIKQVDEQSEGMGRSNRNLSSTQLMVHQIKLDQSSRVTINNKQSLEKIKYKAIQQPIKTESFQEETKQVKSIENRQRNKIIQKISEQKLRKSLWNSIKLIALQRKNKNSSSMSQNQILMNIKNKVDQKLGFNDIKVAQRIKQKIDKLFLKNNNKRFNDIIGTFIRLLGEEGFKKFHDKQIKNPQNKGKFYLNKIQFQKTFIESYQNFIAQQQPEQFLLGAANNFLENQQTFDKAKITSQIDQTCTFSDYLIFIQKLSKLVEQ